MILARRLLTAPLGLIVLLLLFAGLISCQVNSTLLNPGYYIEKLRQADVYRFALVDVTTSALDEARALGAEDLPEALDENPLVTVGLSTEEIVSSLNRAVPPEWVQAQAEGAISQVGPYINGGQDQFEVSLHAGDRVDPAVEELKTLLRKANAYDLLFAEVVAPAAKNAAAQELPLGIKLTSSRLEQSARRIVPPEWVQQQVETALDEVTPYIAGEADSFEVRVQLSDRVPVALDEIKKLLREADAYNLMYDQVIEPAVKERLGSSVTLPFGFEVTNEEVISALRQVAPPDWVQQQAELLIDQAGPYITGQTESLALSVSLVDNKQAARTVIQEIVDNKLEAAVAGLPTCRAGSPSATFQIGQIELPTCIPPQIRPELVASTLGLAVPQVIDQFVISRIPDTAQFTEADLRQTLALAGAEENLDLVDDIRKIVREGWAYTDEDLRRDIAKAGGDEAVQRLDDARAFLGDGWTYTEADLREDIGQADVEDLDRVRSHVNRFRSLYLLVFLPVALLLVAIGFLGGRRRWSSRFAWAAGYLAAISLIILIISWPVYSAVAAPRIDEAIDEALADISPTPDFAGTQQLIIDKSREIISSVVGDLMPGIAVKSLILLIVGIVLLIVCLNWDRVVRLVRRRSGGQTPRIPEESTGTS